MGVSSFNRLGTVFKSPEVLARQLEEAEGRFGVTLRHPQADWSTLSPTELKTAFAVRWQAYYTALATCQAEANGRSIDGAIDLHWLNRQVTLLNHLADREESLNGRALRDYQLPVFERIAEFLELGGRSGYIALPTGTGKTVIFSKLVGALAGKSLIVVPTKELLEQTVDELKKSAPNLNIGVIGGDLTTGYSEGVTVITYKSFLTACQSGEIINQKFDTIVLDEAHKALGERTQEEVKRLLGHSIILGFTATPEYSEQKSLKNLLGQEIYRMEVHEAIDIGALCDVRVIAARSKLGIQDISAVSGDYNLAELSDRINQPDQNRQVVATYEYGFQGQKAVAFCASIQHAKDLADTFRQSGVAAEAISGEDSDDSRRQKIKAFKEGRIKVLCNADLLTHGFDDAEVSVCLNCTPTLSQVVAKQRAGRVLRLDPANPDKVAVIVEFIFEDRPRSRLPITFNQVLGGVALYSSARSRTSTSLPLDERMKHEDPPMDIDLVVGEIEVQELLDTRQKKLSANAPPGWLTNFDLMVELDRSYVSIRSKALELAEDPAWVGSYRYNGNITAQVGKLLDHYHPELVTKLREHFLGSDRPDLYAGWFTIEHFCGLSGLNGVQTRERFLDRYLADTPSWRVTGQRDYALYSPELEALVRRDIANANGPIPEGWVERRGLSRMFSLSAAQLETLLVTFLADNPDWERWYKIDKSYRRHYSPEVTSAIEETIVRWGREESEQPNRPNWVYYDDLFKRDYSGRIDPHSKTNQLLKSILNELKAEQPEAFAIHRKRGKSYAISSPEVTSEAKNRLEHLDLLLQGWSSLEAHLAELPPNSRARLEQLIADPSQSVLKDQISTIVVRGQARTLISPEARAWIIMQLTAANS